MNTGWSEDSVSNNNKLTDEQIEDISKQMDEAIKDTPSEKIIQFPSNNGVEENEGNTEKGEYKVVDATINPNTGETMLLGDTNTKRQSLDDIIEEINKAQSDNLEEDEEVNDRDITMQDITDFMSDKNNEDQLLQMSKDAGISKEALQDLLDVVNRKCNGEEFSLYRALPDEIKKMIDNYLRSSGILNIGVDISKVNFARNNIAESLIAEFISNIKLSSIKKDFAKEMSDVYAKSTKDIAEASIKYIEERNKAYREAAEKIEDPEKKQRFLNVVDQIDDARSLNSLKEFAKKCKIRHIDLEMPRKIYKVFKEKYSKSSNNIYDITVAKQVLLRHMTDVSEQDIDLFFIAFCKQVSGYTASDIIQHSYMYYVMYYCAMLDADTSDNFKNAIKEVIACVKERNKKLLEK